MCTYKILLSGPIFQIKNNSNQIFEFSLEQDACRVDDPLKCQHMSIPLARITYTYNRPSHTKRC